MFKVVRHNTVRFIERFGKLKKTLKPGIHFYLPYINRVTKAIELKETYKEFDHRKVITKDNVEIDVDGIFFYKIRDPEKAVYSVEDYNRAIEDLSMSVSRSEIGKTKLDDMFQHRKELNERIRHAMNQSASTWGIDCLNYEVLKIEPPKKIKEALRFVADAERIKRRDVIISEAEKDYQVAIAEAEKIASIIVEEGKAEIIRIKAEELANGISEFGQKLGEGPNAKILVQYLVFENYIRKYRELLKKSNTVVFPENVDGKMDGGLLSLAYIMKHTKGNNDFLDNTKRETYERYTGSRSNNESALNLNLDSRYEKSDTPSMDEKKQHSSSNKSDHQTNQSDIDNDIMSFLSKIDNSTKKN